MSQDDKMRARVAGRDAVAARTVWTLMVGALAARCLRESDGTFVVQGRKSNGWTAEIGRGTDALKLLRDVAGSKGVASAIGSAS